MTTVLINVDDLSAINVYPTNCVQAVAFKELRVFSKIVAFCSNKFEYMCTECQGSRGLRVMTKTRLGGLKLRWTQVASIVSLPDD